MFGFSPKADIDHDGADVRYVPKLMRRSKRTSAMRLGLAPGLDLKPFSKGSVWASLRHFWPSPAIADAAQEMQRPENFRQMLQVVAARFEMSYWAKSLTCFRAQG